MNPMFLKAMNFIITKLEGGGQLSLDPKDPGNWTGGAQGKGTLEGTKWGISAAEYPTMDIKGLRFEDALRIYERDYWVKIQGDSLPPRVAYVCLDCAVNQGVPVAARCLQEALGLDQDGTVGPATIGAARGVDQDELLDRFLSVRALRYTREPKDKLALYGKGWFARIIRVGIEATRA
jgi:lysozyme family protein